MVCKPCRDAGNAARDAQAQAGPMVATAMVLVAIQEHVRCVGGCDCQHQMPYELGRGGDGLPWDSSTA